ncbi:MAG: short-chain dehydrogenase [Melioribacteraceae bacterium]|nr:short-chain dehydrogenase [Melioribacteraceae bacterium]
MDIQNKTVLVLGAFGLVGNAVTRKLISENPRRIIATSLFENEAKEYVSTLKIDYPDKPEGFFVPWWGNIFVRNEFKDINRFEILSNRELRLKHIHDIMDDFTDDILQESSIYNLVTSYQPDIIIDCINSATGIAYQDIYTTYRSIKKTIESDASKDELIDMTEKLISTLYIPQLIRHIQILYSSMSKSKTEIYVKVGTSGTGGMGLNIPYTHSEERPSRVLLSKSSVAGAHSLLLFLMGRTPEGAITKEIKPTAAIAWKGISYGEIKKKGDPIKLYDLGVENAVELNGNLQLQMTNQFDTSNEVLKSVFIDTGENGTFSRGEFEAITAQGQMEYVTPEEIAQDVLFEIKGGNTGHDIINALDNATFGPTYRAGFLQNSAVEELQELEEKHGTSSVAFELLGPPRLSKLLHEVNLLKLCFGDMRSIIAATPEELTNKVFELIRSNKKLSNEIISIGIPILLPDGKKLLRGNQIKIPPFRGENELELTEKNIELWSHDGWVDLRESNMKRWQKRFELLIKQTEKIPAHDTSSLHVRNRRYWKNFKSIDIGKVVAWIFIDEEKGKRMKD